MTLTKREKILLEIMICLAVFSIILVFLVFPQLEKRMELLESNKTLTSEYEDKMKLMEDNSLDSRYQSGLETAKKNYDYFYGVLNSYTIDGIINNSAKDAGLLINTLKITDYEDAANDFAVLEKLKIKILVKSTVNVTVTGSYENILKFMDTLNQKSMCLRADTLSITQNAQDATGSRGMTASLKIYIYGINNNLKGLDIGR